MSETGLTPEGIRQIRGSRSQAEFARLLGVSPITVYRWELSRGEGQSRTPRRAMQERLRALEGGASPAAPRAPTGIEVASSRPTRDLLPEELAHLLPILDAVFECRWRDAEEAVLPFLQSQDCCLGMRSFGQVVVALVQAFERADGRAAFSTLQPALEVVGRLPAWIAARVHMAAALVFSFPDGQIFHLGRVHAHATAAEALLPRHGEEDVRCLLLLAELVGARFHGDATLLRDVLARSRDVVERARSPLVRCLAGKLRAASAMMRGRLPEATEILEQLAVHAEGLGYLSLQFSALVHLAWLRVLGESPVDELATLLVRTRRVADRARLVPGVYDCILEGVSSEIHFRRADFEGAREALRRAEALEERIAWPVLELLFPRLRMYTLTQDLEGLERLQLRVPAVLARHSLVPDRLVREAIAGYLAMARGQLAAARQHLEVAAHEAREVGTLPWLEACVGSMLFYLTLLAGDLEAAQAARREAERSLSRFPARWIAAHFRQFLGIHAAVGGRAVESAQHLDSALETFRRCGDRVQAALTNRCLAVAAHIGGQPHAPELLESSAMRLEELGLEVPFGVRLEWVEKMRGRVEGAAMSPGEEVPASHLVVPLQRLTQRGLSREEVASELLAATAELVGERPLWVCALDDGGCASPLASRGHTEGLSPELLFEFSDGMGVRLRLGLVAPLSEAHRSVVSALVMVAEQTLEIASLRSLGVTEGGTAAAAAEEVPGVVAASAPMRTLVRDLGRLRNSRSSVLITGESGTGKEVIARLLHESSARALEPYVTFNCSTVPRDLFEGQLFGHRKGSFTGADRDHPGVIRAADGGTLFLDEIGDLPLDVQPKLLRFLENREIMPLGETRPVPVDVRVVAATHKDLADLVRRGLFREDLFFRLQVVPVHLPPLRERREDIVPLVKHFLASLTPDGEAPPRLSPGVIASLLEYDWPGNVREVRNVVERALAYQPVPPVLGAEHLHPPPRVGGAAASGTLFAPGG